MTDKDKIKLLTDALKGCVSMEAGSIEKGRDLLDKLNRNMTSPKTYQQVKTIFGLMIQQTIEQANDLGIDVSGFLKYLLSAGIPKGQGLTKDFLIDLAYVICPTVDEEGRRVTLSKMNTIQAANLFERFRATIAPCGIVIDDPRPDWNE